MQFLTSRTENQDAQGREQIQREKMARMLPRKPGKLTASCNALVHFITFTWYLSKNSVEFFFSLIFASFQSLHTFPRIVFLRSLFSDSCGQNHHFKYHLQLKSQEDVEGNGFDHFGGQFSWVCPMYANLTLLDFFPFNMSHVNLILDQPEEPRRVEENFFIPQHSCCNLWQNSLPFQG